MNKICAIICEYDPFHNGHKYHIAQARKESGCDYILCLMSGSITQRGYPAIADKHLRAKMALKNGADIVVLLPSVYATASASGFAFGACKMLQALNVSHLSFGTENTDIDLNYTKNNFDFSKLKELSKGYSKTGVNSAKAYQQAVQKLYGDEFASAFDKPNFVLGYEYTKALALLKSKIVAVPILRTNDYNDTNLANPYASATAIRTALDLGNDCSMYVPYDTRQLNNTVDINLYKSILTLSLKNKDISKIQQLNEVTEGLGYLLKKICNDNSKYDDIINNAKSKRYLHSRIRRILLYSYLDIDKTIAQQSQKVDTLPFFNILGIKQSAMQLLGHLPKNSIIKYSDIVQCDDFAKQLISIEQTADNLYSVVSNYFGNLFVGSGLIKIV